MKLIQDLREFIELLNSENVQYLVIGGWARNRYGTPRVTGDIDFFVSDSTENQNKLKKVLQKFGFGSSIDKSKDKLFEKKMLVLGRPPNRIDLLSEISGISFDDAWKNRVEGSLEGIPVLYISKADFLTNKKSTGRTKDLLDIEDLEST